MGELWVPHVEKRLSAERPEQAREVAQGFLHDEEFDQHKLWLALLLELQSWEGHPRLRQLQTQRNFILNQQIKEKHERIST